MFTSDSLQKEHVVILFGGPSVENDVSKLSAKAVEKAYMELGISYSMLEYQTISWVEDIQKLKPTFVFNAMHGVPGEDGSVQAVLDELQLAYNGSDAKSSTLAMNKSLSKKALNNAKLPVAKEFLLQKGQPIPNIIETGLQFPLVVKPNNGGSSVGIEIILTTDDWPKAKKRLEVFIKKDPQAMLFEEFIQGKELTVPVFFDKTYGVMEIMTGRHEFYDYASKYNAGGSHHIYPASIATEVQIEAEKIALQTHKTLGCGGVTRVDFRYDEEGRGLVILELNTLPGMTNVSLLPDVAIRNNIPFTQLVLMMMKDGQCTHQQKNLKSL